MGVPSALYSPEEIDANPAITNAGNGNDGLQSGSPVTGQGAGAELPADVADLDGDSDVQEATPLERVGGTRVVGAEVDLGAYEIQ